MSIYRERLWRISTAKTVSQYMQAYGLIVNVVNTSTKPYIQYTRNNKVHEFTLENEVGFKYIRRHNLIYFTLCVLRVIAKREKLPFFVRMVSGRFKGSVGQLSKSTNGFNVITSIDSVSTVILNITQTTGINRILLDPTATCCELIYNALETPVDVFGNILEVDDVIVVDGKPGIFESWDDMDKKALINFGNTTRRVLLRGYVNASQLNVKQAKDLILVKRLSTK